MELNERKANLIQSSLILISPFFLWGTAMVAMKGVIPYTTPLFMAGVRSLPAGILVLMVASLTGREQPKTWRAWLWIAFFALVDGAMFQGFLAEGLVRTGAGLGSVMIDSQPIAVALLSSWLFGEVIGLWGWLGLLIGILGISLIGLPDDWIIGLFHSGSNALTSVDFSFSLIGLFNSGEWWMLLAALSMAIGTVTIRFVARHADVVVATGWHLVIGGGLLFALSGMGESAQWVNMSRSNWLSLSYATVFGSAVSYGVFFWLATRGSLTSLSSLTFLTPVFALGFGNLLLGEVLSNLQWLGVCLTLISIYLINQRDRLNKQAILLWGQSLTRQKE